jgi:hypothetical protein
MKKLAIYFSDPDLMGYPFDKSVYFETYNKILTAILSKGVQPYIVRGKTYVGGGGVQ